MKTVLKTVIHIKPSTYGWNKTFDLLWRRVYNYMGLILTIGLDT